MDGMISFRYQEIVKVATVQARMEVLEMFLEEALGNVSLAARMCGVSRHNKIRLRKITTTVKTGCRDYNPLDYHPFEFIQLLSQLEGW